MTQKTIFNFVPRSDRVRLLFSEHIYKYSTGIKNCGPLLFKKDTVRHLIIRGTKWDPNLGLISEFWNGP